MASKGVQDNGRNASASQEADRAGPGQPFGMGAFSPEAALGVWSSWIKGHPGQPMPGFADMGEAGKGMQAGLDQLAKMFVKDPVLSSVDRMWNANPLHEVIPVDWAEVVRALRTVSG
jgi:polyhydroxyalkanoate synthase subunit PhaC